MNTYELRKSVGTILVSPHPDDVAFSVGGTILTTLLPRPFLIVSLFTRSAYAPYHAGNHDPDTVSLIREKEDMAFAQSTGSHLVRLNFRDSALNVGTREGKFPLLFLSTLLYKWPRPESPFERNLTRISSKGPPMLKHRLILEAARFDRRYRLLEAAISKLLHKNQDAVLISPLGLGCHPDHLLASRACKRLGHLADKVYYYEDLPYARRYSIEGIAKHARGLDRKLRPLRVDISGLVESKTRNLLLYRSQVSSDHVMETKEHTARLGNGAWFEELWTY